MSKKAKSADLPRHILNEHGEAAGGSEARCDNWAEALHSWRTIPAYEFSDAHRAAIADCLSRTSSTSEIWRKAIRGDASLAICVALTMPPTDKVNARTDLSMTVLLSSALAGSAGAGLVLAHLIRKLPLELEPTEKNRLATSWVLHNFKTLLSDHSSPNVSQRLRRSPSIASHFLGKEESNS